MNDLALLSALLFKHLICNYPLQTPCHFMNKGICGNSGGLLHVGLHAMGTFIVLSFFAPVEMVLCLALLDAFIHYHIEWPQHKINRRFDLKPTGGADVWFTCGLDRYLHQMTYILLTFLLVR